MVNIFQQEYFKLSGTFLDIVSKHIQQTTLLCKQLLYALGNEKNIHFIAIHFIALVWNQTCSISEVCLSVFVSRNEFINRISNHVIISQETSVQGLNMMKIIHILPIKNCVCKIIIIYYKKVNSSLSQFCNTQI